MAKSRWATKEETESVDSSHEGSGLFAAKIFSMASAAVQAEDPSWSLRCWRQSGDALSAADALARAAGCWDVISAQRALNRSSSEDFLFKRSKEKSADLHGGYEERHDDVKNIFEFWRAGSPAPGLGQEAAVDFLLWIDSAGGPLGLAADLSGSSREGLSGINLRSRRLGIIADFASGRSGELSSGFAGKALLSLAKRWDSCDDVEARVSLAEWVDVALWSGAGGRGPRLAVAEAMANAGGPGPSIEQWAKISESFAQAGARSAASGLAGLVQGFAGRFAEPVAHGLLAFALRRDIPSLAAAILEKSPDLSWVMPSSMLLNQGAAKHGQPLPERIPMAHFALLEQGGRALKMDSECARALSRVPRATQEASFKIPTAFMFLMPEALASLWLARPDWLAPEDVTGETAFHKKASFDPIGFLGWLRELGAGPLGDAFGQSDLSGLTPLGIARGLLDGQGDARLIADFRELVSKWEHRQLSDATPHRASFATKGPRL